MAVQDEKQMMEIAHENIRMSEPLHKARQVRGGTLSARWAAVLYLRGQQQLTVDIGWLYGAVSVWQDVERLKQELKRYSVEKEELRSIKARLLVVEDKYRQLKWENEVSGLKVPLLLVLRPSTRISSAS